MITTPNRANMYFRRLKEAFDGFLNELSLWQDQLRAAGFYPPPDRLAGVPLSPEYEQWKSRQEVKLDKSLEKALCSRVIETEGMQIAMRNNNMLGSPLFEYVMNHLDEFNSGRIVDAIRDSIQVLDIADHVATVEKLLSDVLKDYENGCATCLLEDPTTGFFEGDSNPLSSSDSFLYNMVGEAAFIAGIKLERRRGVWGYLEYIKKYMEDYKIGDIEELLLKIDDKVRFRFIDDAFFTGDQKGSWDRVNCTIRRFLDPPYSALGSNVKDGDDERLSKLFISNTQIYVVGSTTNGFERVDGGRDKTYAHRHIKTIPESLDENSLILLLYLTSVVGNDDLFASNSFNRIDGPKALLYMMNFLKIRGLIFTDFKVPDRFSIPKWLLPLFWVGESARLYCSREAIKKIVRSFDPKSDELHRKGSVDPNRREQEEGLFDRLEDHVKNLIGKNT